MTHAPSSKRSAPANASAVGNASRITITAEAANITNAMISIADATIVRNIADRAAITAVFAALSTASSLPDAAKQYTRSRDITDADAAVNNNTTSRDGDKSPSRF
ncbi:hypothetical protein FACS1894219_08500 [Clostridia bacterium]|nr:hypothetical protein FACS1894219_08500 [Clostridia bacterium]